MKASALLALALLAARPGAAAHDPGFTFTDGDFAVKPGAWWDYSGPERAPSFVRYTWSGREPGMRLDIAVDQTRPWTPEHPAVERLKRLETAGGIWQARPEGTSLGLKRLGGYWSKFRVGGADRGALLRAVMPIPTGIVELQCYVPRVDIPRMMERCRQASDTLNWKAAGASVSAGENNRFEYWPIIR